MWLRGQRIFAPQLLAGHGLGFSAADWMVAFCVLENPRRKWRLTEGWRGRLRTWACAGEGTTTWSVQCICCVRRSSLVALVWLSRKFSFSLLVVSRSGGSAAEGVPEAAHSRPTEQSTLIDRLIAARVASSSSNTAGAGGTGDPSSSTSSLYLSR